MLDWFPGWLGVGLVSRVGRCWTSLQKKLCFDWLAGRLWFYWFKWRLFFNWLAVRDSAYGY